MSSLAVINEDSVDGQRIFRRPVVIDSPCPHRERLFDFSVGRIT